MAALRSPLGPHQWDIPLSNLDVHPIKEGTLMAISLLYTVAAVFMKSTFLALYLRIFQPARGATIFLWVSLAAIALFYGACFIAEAVVCGLSANEQLLIKHSEAFKDRLFQQRPLWIIVGVFSVVSDFYLLAIPVGLTLNIRLPTKQKIGVCCVFLTGLIACAFSIVSTAYRIRMFESPDITWLGSLVYAFTAAELNVGITCSCMPVTFVVFQSLTKNILWDSLSQLITRPKQSHGDSVPDPSDPDTHTLEEQLPPISHISSIGSTSIIRKAHLSQFGRESGMSMYDELALIEYDYHAQLRKESNSGKANTEK
ncbi:hypothetical protein F5Y13DRAFT_204785 [Hypoxylon sp. FL1857]|nr:hypothetical protein F5Y13DRAFT_204785 [Hypoxylon sp. FL1857]